jgi:hypothetical protein
LLRPLLVANPYAPELTFQDGQIRTRRDHMKYLTLIRTIALLHQHQRPVKTVMHNGKSLQYLEVTRADIEMANRLAHEVLGRSLDELPPHTRKLLELLDGMVAEGCKKLGVDRADYRFTRRQVREATGWGNTQLKLHLERLADMEYLAVHPKGQSYAYELLYDGQGQAGRPFLSGLIDVEKLEIHDYDGNRSGSEADRSGQKGDRSGTGRGVVGPWSGGGRGVENAAEADEQRAEPRSGPDQPETALKGGESGSSYVHEGSYAYPEEELAAAEAAAGRAGDQERARAKAAAKGKSSDQEGEPGAAGAVASCPGLASRPSSAQSAPPAPASSTPFPLAAGPGPGPAAAPGGGRASSSASPGGRP